MKNIHFEIGVNVYALGVSCTLPYIHFEQSIIITQCQDEVWVLCICVRDFASTKS